MNNQQRKSSDNSVHACARLSRTDAAGGVRGRAAGKFVFYFKVALLLVRTHLRGLQVLAIFHPAVRRLRLPRGFALPHQRIINELLDILGFLNELRRGCKWKKMYIIDSRNYKLTTNDPNHKLHRFTFPALSLIP